VSEYFLMNCVFTFRHFSSVCYNDGHEELIVDNIAGRWLS